MYPKLINFADGQVQVFVIPHADHGWLMSTADAAAGYGSTEEAIRQAKKRHADELLEGIHYVTQYGVFPSADPEPAPEPFKIASAVPFSLNEMGTVENAMNRLADSGALEDADGIAFAMRSTQSRKPDMERCAAKIAEINASAQAAGNARSRRTLWTRAGVIRLGFFIRGEHTKEFRAWAESCMVDPPTRPKRQVQLLGEAEMLCHLAAEVASNSALAPGVRLGILSRLL